MRMRYLALPLIALVVVACTMTGSVGISGKKGKITYEVKVEWSFKGDKNLCGCIYWTDKDGNDLANVAPGVVTGGSGGGVVPPRARGWRGEFEDCKDFDGCDKKDSTGPSGPPLPDTDGTPLVGRTFQFLGHVMGPWGFIDYDVTILSASRVQARQKLGVILEQRDGHDVPAGTEIHSLTFGDAVFSGKTFDGFDVLVLDNEPISAYAMRVNGIVEHVNLGSQYAGHGYWRVRHAITTTNLDLNWASTSNTVETKRFTQGDGTRDDQVTVTYDAARK